LLAREVHIRRTRAAAPDDLWLNRFLEEYRSPSSYLDWGDDPAFFCARHHFGDVRSASWGVCRRDVRASLYEGDFVAFFCARQSDTQTRHWDYYYIGVGTVSRRCSRADIWTDEQLVSYR